MHGPRVPIHCAALCALALVLLLARIAGATGPDLHALRQRAHALSERDGLDEHARGALAQAELALERAEREHAEGTAAATDRAARIAAAALTLAERRLAQSRTLSALARTERRLRTLLRDLERLREALEVELERQQALEAQFVSQRESVDAP